MQLLCKFEILRVMQKQNFTYSLADRWACCPSHSRSHLLPKALGSQGSKVAGIVTLTGRQSEQLTINNSADRIWEHLRHRLFLGFSLKSGHIFWSFLQNQVIFLVHGKWDLVYQIRAGQAPNLKLQCYLGSDLSLSPLSNQCSPKFSGIKSLPLYFHHQHLVPVSGHIKPEHHQLLRIGKP